jgi:hypothetical protein
VSYLALPRALNHAHGIGGLVERIFLGSQLLWIIVVMIDVIRATSLDRRPVPRPDADDARIDRHDRNSAL